MAKTGTLIRFLAQLKVRISRSSVDGAILLGSAWSTGVAVVIKEGKWDLWCHNAVVFVVFNQQFREHGNRTVSALAWQSQ